MRERSDGPGAAAQADLDRRQRSQAVSGRHLAAAVRATAPRRSRALLRGLAVRALLVGDTLRRHFRGRTRSRELFVEFGTRRHSGHRSAERAGVCELHPDGPARPHRASPHRRADRGAVQPRQSRAADPQAHRRRAGRAAAQRDLRLGRARLDRPHQHDAGDPVRFPLGGPRKADLVVRCRDRQCRCARCRRALGGGAHRRTQQDGRIFPEIMGCPRQRRADLRPDLDAGAFGSDTKSAGARIHRHDRAFDRRRQRHHAQFHERRADGAGRKPRAVRTGAQQGAN